MKIYKQSKDQPGKGNEAKNQIGTLGQRRLGKYALLLIVLPLMLISCSPSPRINVNSPNPNATVGNNSGSGTNGNSGASVTTTNSVQITSGTNGFKFKNLSNKWVWVSFALLNCARVDSVYSCNNQTWDTTIALGPSSYSSSLRSCTLMESVKATMSTDPIYDTYSYTVQWIAYIDFSDGNDYTPTTYPKYSSDLGVKTHVIEDAGTDHGSTECL
ncbi:MAG: hypothetical protein HKL80_06980 [Acidimicrobiales bacterium]|nr:hypothetical protein [Acidimicrobiales bacterium]